jgi:hypothetical protein
MFAPLPDGSDVDFVSYKLFGLGVSIPVFEGD